MFQRHGLDYCCGGHASLEHACRAKGLDPAAVMEEIAQGDAAPVRPRWDLAPLPELIRFIVSRYHDKLRAELPELIALAERVETRHADAPACPRGA